MFDVSRYNFEVTPEMARAWRIYEDEIKPRHGDEIDGQLIVIEAESGDYVMDSDFHRAVEDFRARWPKGERVFVLEEQVVPGHLAGLGIVLWAGLTPEEQASLPPYGED